MRSYNLYLTIQGNGVKLEKIHECLRTEFPDWDITLSEQDFEDWR